MPSPRLRRPVIDVRAENAAAPRLGSKLAVAAASGPMKVGPLLRKRHLAERRRHTQLPVKLIIGSNLNGPPVAIGGTTSDKRQLSIVTSTALSLTRNAFRSASTAWRSRA